MSELLVFRLLPGALASYIYCTSFNIPFTLNTSQRGTHIDTRMGEDSKANVKGEKWKITVEVEGMAPLTMLVVSEKYI